MPNLPISSLPELTATTSNAEYVVELSGTTYKIKQSTLTPIPNLYGLFSQTGNSTPVSATTAITSIINGGLGFLTVPANGFKVGDSFSGKIFGHLSSKNNDKLNITVKSGSVILGATSTITMPQATNKHFSIDLNFTIRKVGGAGTASIVSGGFFSYNKDASNSIEGESFSTINDTTFDTTITNTLDVTVQWSSTSVQNIIYSEYFVLYKIFST